MRPTAKKSTNNVTIFERIRFTWVITVLLFVASLASLLALKDDWVAYFVGGEGRGPLISPTFALDFTLAVVLSVSGVCLLLLSRAREEKLLLKVKSILPLFLFSLLFNLVLLGAFILTSGFLFDKLQFGLYLYDLILVNLMVFSVVSFFAYDGMLRALKREETFVDTIKTTCSDGFRKFFPFGIAIALLNLSFIILGGVKGVFIFLSVIMAVIIAFYSSSLFLFDAVCVLNKILVLIKRKNES